MEKRIEQKSVTFTMEEKKLIEKAAKVRGLSYGSFLRSSALEKAMIITEACSNAN